MLQSRHTRVRAGEYPRAIKVAREGPLQDVLDEGGLSRPADAGDGDEEPEWNLDVDVAKVVFAGTLDPHHATGVSRATLLGNADAFRAGEILAGDRTLVPEHLRHRSRGDHLAAVLAGAGAKVNEVVRGANRLLVVLDDQHRVAHVAQAHERREQPRVVALVQPDAWLVEDVQHTHESGPDLGGQANALCFATRQ